MAALMDARIEAFDGSQIDSPGNRQSQISTTSSRAKAFVKTLSNHETSNPSAPTPSLSISLNTMHDRELNGRVGNSSGPTSISAEVNTSLRNNFGDSSLKHRLKKLDLTPSHSKPETERRKEVVSTLEAQAVYEYVEYRDVDTGQRAEFERLLKRESGCSRSWLHKGLVANLLFLMALVVGVVLGEVFFPQEGVRGRGIPLMNDTSCQNNTPACYTVRIVRAVGLFGFIGGVTNWIAIEMLFRSIPFVFGTGVFSKNYKNIRETLKRLVVELLFDPSQLRQYFTGRQRNLREIFQLENHFGGLLESEATSNMVDKKIDAILDRPEGYVVTNMMGMERSHLKGVLKHHIQSFIMEISPSILDRISSGGLTDGVGLQAEVERILEERTEELTRSKVRQLMSAMIRKHLNWLIIWGNILGALAGLVAEVVAIVTATYTNT